LKQQESQIGGGYKCNKDYREGDMDFSIENLRGEIKENKEASGSHPAEIEQPFKGDLVGLRLNLAGGKYGKWQRQLMSPCF
jgi:hypothetical protein